MYIGYDIKYAKVCTGKRVDGKVVTTQKSLGRVLDEAAGIYQSRERGVFTFNVETGEYGIPDASFVPNGTRRKNAREKLILNFGDAFVLDEYIGRAGMWDVADSLGYGNPDTLRCMILYYILENRSNQLAQAWHEGSYASVRYPKANLTSQRISDLLSAVGGEGSQRAFFAEYFKLVGEPPWWREGDHRQYGTAQKHPQRQDIKRWRGCWTGCWAKNAAGSTSSSMRGFSTLRSPTTGTGSCWRAPRTTRPSTITSATAATSASSAPRK